MTPLSKRVLKTIKKYRKTCGKTLDINLDSYAESLKDLDELLPEVKRVYPFEDLRKCMSHFQRKAIKSAIEYAKKLNPNTATQTGFFEALNDNEVGDFVVNMDIANTIKMYYIKPNELSKIDLAFYNNTIKANAKFFSDELIKIIKTR